MMRILWIISILLLPFSIYSQEILIENDLRYIDISDHLEYLTDSSCEMSLSDVQNSGAFTSSEKMWNLNVSNNCHWFRFSITNNSNSEHYKVSIDHPILDFVELHDSDTLISKISNIEPFYQRKYLDPNFIFDVDIPKGESKTYFLKLYGDELVVVPVSLAEPAVMTSVSQLREMLFGIYAGIIIVMILYNLFVYFSVRDVSYLYYVAYILMIGLTQISLKGYTSKYIWPNSEWLNSYGVVIVSCLSGISAIEFMKVFLRSKVNAPRLHKVSYVMNGLFIIALMLVFVSVQDGFGVMQLATLIGTLYAFTLAINIARQGYRPAKFFLIAWSILLIGAIIFVLKDFEILPFNLYTNYSLQAASVLEVILLSFALADRINIMRREKEESQREAMEALEENERIVREQNVMLEAKVDERTAELKVANKDLNTALINLKEAQSQLVSAEKMASLGQLTAGIAHEINNPINFVTSSVIPLRENVKELTELINKYEKELVESGDEERLASVQKFKEEISFDLLMDETQEIIENIGEGANRTAEIVSGLRTFSHVDDIGLKKVDINEGINSTLKLLGGEIPKNVEIELNYNDLQPLECYGGKINQVFMNVINNAIQAVKSRGEEIGGKVSISTEDLKEGVKVIIEDDGIGMDNETREKMFEPFFTTKDVGEGTGLGLSVVYGIIESHHGTIDVHSEPDKGTTIIINLPYIQPS